MKRSVLTIATGKPLFVQLAATLARSFRLWNAGNGIGFAIATDQPDALPADLDFVDVVPLAPGQYGSGFSPKLYLNEIAPADQTLFVDADCLCVRRPPRRRSRRSAGHAVTVIGRTIRDGEWFGDVAAISGQFGVGGLPRFNGGVYYLERGETSDRVFGEAQAAGGALRRDRLHDGSATGRTTRYSWRSPWRSMGRSRSPRTARS